MSQQVSSHFKPATEKTRFGLWQAKETLLPIMADYSPLLEAELGNSSSAVTPTTNNDGIPDPPESGLSDAEAQRLLEIYGKSSFYPSVLLSNHQQKQLHRHHHVRRCLCPLLALHSLARFPHHSSNPPCFFFLILSYFCFRQLLSFPQTTGYNELASKEPTPIMDFLKNFWGPMPIMIWIAIIVELIPKPEADHVDRPSWADFAVLLCLQIVNGVVGWYEHKKAGDAVAALKNSLSPKANVKRNGQWLSIPGRDLVPGDLVSLAIGGSVPADCRVLGPKCIYCDQAALTGESLPCKIDIGESAKMGSTVATGECDAVVTGTGDKTFFGKTAKLIAGVEDIGHFEKILYKITAALLLLSLLLTGIIMGVLISTNVNFLEVLAICVVLLVASIPIAMNVVCTSTMAIGKLTPHVYTQHCPMY